jgi:D-beta-D-heptose 7-phosphate kinase/D-beta-D-heptose 1-phosphate adenosyltransferase
MIVATEDLHRHRGTVAMVDGGFDPIHAGHVEYFRRASELGVPVLCNVSGDRYVSRKHPPLLPEGERVQVIDAIRYIDYVHLSNTSTEAVLRDLRPRYYVKGDDWRDRLPEGEVAACAEHGIEIVYLDTVTNSSSALLSAWTSARGAASS